MLGACAGTIDPLFYRYLLDLVVRAAAGHIRRGAALRAAEWAVAGMLATNALQQALQAGLTWAANKVRFDASFALSRQSLARVLNRPLSEHLNTSEDQGAGATMTRMDRGVAALGQLTGDLLQSLLPNLANLAILALLMFRLAPRLGWVALSPLPCFLWVSWRATAAGVAAEEEVQDGWRRLYRRIYEVLAAIKTLKSLAGERAEVARYEKGATAIFACLWRQMRLDTGYGAARGLLASAGRAAVFFYGADLALSHRITPGTWIAAVTYAGMIYAPLAGLSGLYTSLSTNLVTAGAALDIPANAEELALAGARPGERARGEIEFDDVSFEYAGDAAGAARPVLRQASFRIAAGEVVALAGPSGGGKTTIADLILGFHRPSRGRIRLDGHELASLPHAWLREQIAVVLQDAVVFEGTIAENIAFGRPEADFAAIRSAARAAQAEEFIARLPQGYETRIGERGARLSGGQRQRLAIARALLRDAPILIFDEASSHLDGDCESALNAALAHALAGRTIIVITHRPASLALADRVLTVSGGRVAECKPPAPADAGERAPMAYAAARRRATTAVRTATATAAITGSHSTERGWPEARREASQGPAVPPSSETVMMPPKTVPVS